MKKIFSDKRAIVIFLLPAALVYAIFAIYPVIMSGYYSLLDWNGVGDAKFIGLSNYVKLFVGNNDGFGSALLNSFILAFLSVFVQLTLSLVLALAITYPKVKKQERFYRTVYFLPAIVSTVIIAELWKKIYHPSYGLLNGFLGMLAAGMAGQYRNRIDRCIHPHRLAVHRQPYAYDVFCNQRRTE